MEVSDWLTAIGWVVSFVLGIAATLFVKWRSRPRKVLAWAVVSESQPFSSGALEEISTGFGVPVSVRIGDNKHVSVSVVRIRLACVGNVELENMAVVFSFGETAKLHVGRYIGDLGVYRERLALTRDETTARLAIRHINPAQDFEVEFLVSEYEEGDVVVDMAEAGVTLKKSAEAVISSSLGRKAFLSANLGLFGMGVRLDAQAYQTARLVDEISSLRAVLKSAVTTREQSQELPAAEGKLIE